VWAAGAQSYPQPPRLDSAVSIAHAAVVTSDPGASTIAPVRSDNGRKITAGVAVADGATMPGPGELLMKQRLSWKTWQLVVTFLVALVIGMVIGNSGGGSGGGTGPGGSSAKAGYTPPPPAGSSSQGSASTTPGAPTTVAANGVSGATTLSSPTSTAGATATTAPGAGTVTVLLPQTGGHGNGASPAFTVAAPGWKLGWAYKCVPAPAPGSSFEIFVDPVSGVPATTPAVTGTAASGSSVTVLSSTGNQELSIRAPTGCQWAVKVTGVA